MKKSVVLGIGTVLTSATLLLAAAPAQAGHVNWSIGINLPLVVPSAPVYAPAYGYAPPVYAPPVYAAPVYAPPAVVYRSVPVAPYPVYYGGPAYVRGGYVGGVYGSPWRHGGWAPVPRDGRRWHH